jgi:hypothetical protein
MPNPYNLIVIKIVPEAPTDPTKFTTYLTALGGLTITANDLSYNNPSPGQIIKSASYLAPSGLSPAPSPLAGSLTQPAYPAGVTSGIVQTYEFVNAKLSPPEPAYYRPRAFATAVIQIPAPPAGQTTFENLRLTVTWGGTQPIPVQNDYYDVRLDSAAVTPDPNQWHTLAPASTSRSRYRRRHRTR